MATHDEIKAAGGNDVGDWGDKDLTGAYPAGTKFLGTDVRDLEGVLGADGNQAKVPLRPSGRTS